MIESFLKFALNTLLIAAFAIGNLAWKTIVLILKITGWTIVTAIVWALLAVSLSLPGVKLLACLGIGLAVTLILETIKPEKKE
jgi:hypothetical protein